MDTPIVVAMIALLGALGTPIVQWYLRNRDKKKELDLVKISMKDDMVVHDLLYSLMESTQSDRVSILQFHNGEKFYHSNVHVKKISKSFEVCSKGIASDIQDSQNLPLNMFHDVIKGMHERGFYLGVDLDVIHDNDYFRIFLIDKGIKSWYAWAIRSMDGYRMIGILAVSYIKDSADMSDKKLIECKLVATKLTGYLSK